MVLYGTRTVPDALPELDVDSKVDRLVLERLPLEQVEACAGFVRHVHLRNRNRADSARCNVPRHVVAQHAMLQHYCVRVCVRVCERTNARVYRREYHSIVLMLQLRDDVCEQQPRVLAPETRRFQRQSHRYLLRLQDRTGTSASGEARTSPAPAYSGARSDMTAAAPSLRFARVASVYRASHHRAKPH